MNTDHHMARMDKPPKLDKVPWWVGKCTVAMEDLMPPDSEDEGPHDG